MSSRQQRRVRERRQQQRPPGQRGQPPARGGRGTTRRGGGGGGVSPWTVALGIAVVLIVAAALYFASTSKNSASSATPTIAPENLAQKVDGVQCNAGEQPLYHVHQHVALYDHGKQIQLPSSIGMPGTEQNALCFYWLHVHAQYPNIIHVESPVSTTWTLGDFFDIWKATKKDAIPQSGNAFLTDLLNAPASQITVFVNGKRWTSGYRTIRLTSHEVIQIDIGKPVVPFKPFSAWGSL